tara:strand:- start:850 stop:1434 length:585 start_codon:yes stop_codon:yes gene_type:complete
MKIGDVVKQLKNEYPSISISKIRFLEKEGLINIPRTKGGTRELSSKEIEIIRRILHLQEKQYVTLKAIKNNPSLLKINKSIKYDLKRKDYSIEEALKISALPSRLYDQLLINELELKKDNYSATDIQRFKSWRYLTLKGLNIDNLSVLTGISERGSDYLDHLIKSNTIPSDETEEIANNLGKIIGGIIYSRKHF